MKYEIITYCEECGADEKREFATKAEAREYARELIRSKGYEGVAIYSYRTEQVVEIWDDFPLEYCIAEENQGNPTYKHTPEWKKAHKSLLYPVYGYKFIKNLC